ncbi:RNA polymerase subunit sigma-70 [Dactylosporangium sp. NPDC049525]|uniref:RNA polymerase subunit sigma-70 n=1 Tax=Dactylosporangium sp. NPDC049525 TaxID=3154730 RepID=UPI0034419546
MEQLSGVEFERLTAPFRRELTTHCYRMTGSAQDAEDLVQETYLRAWRSFGTFEHRSSLRVWLYRIATNVCLSALTQIGRRDLPSGLGQPSDDPLSPLALAGPEVGWVSPLVTPPDPAAVVSGRGSVRLALVAALQHLPATQRAVLILRDVLAWRASEVAELLGTSADAVHSTLARARAQLRRVGVNEESLSEPQAGGAQRRLLEQYAAAFAAADVDALVRVLRDDVALEMPPHLTWFAGRDTVATFLDRVVFAAVGPLRLRPLTVNGAPGFAAYIRQPGRPAGGGWEAHAVQVLTVTPGGISRIVSFNQPSLFALSGLAVQL